MVPVHPASDHQMLCEIWDALLATAPPEQALAHKRSCGSSQPETEGDTERQSGHVISQSSSVQVTSGGALDADFAQIIKAALASHGQKVRAEALEEAARIAEECTSDETRDEKFRIAQTLRSIAGAVKREK